MLRVSSLAAVMSLVWPTIPNPSSVAAIRRLARTAKSDASLAISQIVGLGADLV